MKVVFVAKTVREGRRKDGSSAVFHNVDVMVPGVGAGQCNVDAEVARALDGVPMGTEVEVDFGARVWNGRMEFRPIAFRPVRVKA